MVTKSKLKMALASDKGVDFKKLNLKKKEKAARKQKAQKSGGKILEEKVVEEWEDLDESGSGEDDDGFELSGSEEDADGPMQASHCVQIK